MRAARPAPSRIAGALAAVSLTACASGPMVAPLRYEPDPSAPEEAFRASPPDASPVAPRIALPWRETALPNGLRLVHLERRGLPVVSVRLVIARGQADVEAPLDTYGILGRMLDAGTEQRSERDLAAEYARLGAQRRTAFGVDGCAVSARGRAADLDALLALLAEAATRPRLSAQAFGDVRARWMLDFSSSRGSPDAALSRNLRAALFGRAHAYGFAVPPMEHARDMAGAEVAAAYAQLFHPAQATLVVVGDVTPELALAGASRWLGAWRGAAAPPARAELSLPPPGGPRVIGVTVPARVLAEIVIAARVPVVPEPELAALDVLAQALGGMSSPLHTHVRDEHGAAYSFGAGTSRMRAGAIVEIGGSFQREKAMTTLHAMLLSIHEARRGVIDAERLTRAKASLIAGWRNRVSTTEGVAGMVESALARGAPLDEIAAYPARIQAVTAADVQRAAATHLADEALRIVVVGDHTVVWQAQVSGLGTFERRNGLAQTLP